MNIEKTKLYIAPAQIDFPNCEGLSDVGLINLFYGVTNIGSTIFTSKIPKEFKFESFTFVSSIDESNYVILPHSVRKITPQITVYLDSVRLLAEKHNRKIIVFIIGDMSHDVFIDDMIVLKLTQYTYLKKPNEIVVPPFSEDLSEISNLSFREKSLKPIIGFCGWASFAKKSQLVKYWLRLASIYFSKVFLHKKYLDVHKKGVYYRKKALKILSKSNLVSVKSIIRPTFSGSLKTISISPSQARREYVDTIINSDLTLSPKGDANYSVRFYETLSLGRIPLLIDTETILPFEWKLNYNNAILRVNYTQLSKLPDIVSVWYSKLSQNDFEFYQKNARDLYIRFLRYDSFYNVLFSRPLEETLKKQSEYYGK